MKIFRTATLIKRYDLDGETPNHSVLSEARRRFGEEPYEADVIEKYGVRGVIGKGGMGSATLAACGKFGSVYLSAVGGLATILAHSVIEVVDVHKLDEWGAPEAMWVIRVKDFPAVVTMDAHGKSIHDDIAALSKANYDRLIAGE